MKFQEWIFACVMCIGCLRKYKFVFKNLILGTLEKKITYVRKKRHVNDFSKGNVRQLICSKYGKGRMQVIR
jgi:hypothetical protein